MFSRALTALILALLAAAAPQTSQPSCSTGTLQCCQDFQSADSPLLAYTLELAGVALPDTTSLFGFGCTSSDPSAGYSGGACGAGAVCCTNSIADTAIFFGCEPVVPQ